MPQIVCENLSLGYEGETIVKDLSFSVEAGMYLCIVGENGAGKSTLMKAILGLRPPISGRVLFGDGLKDVRVDGDSMIFHFRERFDEGRLEFDREFFKGRRLLKALA